MVSVELPEGRVSMRRLLAGSTYLWSENRRAHSGLGAVWVTMTGRRHHDAGHVDADHILGVLP